MTVAKAFPTATVSRRPSRVARCSGVSDEFGPRECFDWADRTVTLSHVAVAEYLSAAGFDVSGFGQVTVLLRVLPPSPLPTRT